MLSQARREIVYEVKDPAFCFTILEQPRDLLQLSRDIAQRMDDVEKCKVRNGTPRCFFLEGNALSGVCITGRQTLLV